MASARIDADAVALRLLDDLAVGRAPTHAALTALEDRSCLGPRSRRILTCEIGRARPAAVMKLSDASDPRVR
jgi:hypothetical protein